MCEISLVEQIIKRAMQRRLSHIAKLLLTSMVGNLFGIAVTCDPETTDSSGHQDCKQVFIYIR